VRVREPFGHAGGRAAATHEPVHADGGQGERLLVSVAAQPDEQGLLVEQPDAAGEGMDLEPGFERLLDGLRDRGPRARARLCRVMPGRSLCRVVLALRKFSLLARSAGAPATRHKSSAF